MRRKTRHFFNAVACHLSVLGFAKTCNLSVLEKSKTCNLSVLEEKAGHKKTPRISRDSEGYINEERLSSMLSFDSPERLIILSLA